MNAIIDFLSSIMGVLMDVFFRGLTLIGYPRLWACVVLYAIVTRLFFLPERINNCKSVMLAPVVKRDLLAGDPNFFEQTKDKELLTQRAALKKQVHKKYKISERSGCLVSLIQYPLLVALFYVVKNPQEFVPSLESISEVSTKVNSFLGLSLSEIPLENFSFDSLKGLVMLVPLIIVISNIIKMWPTIRKAKRKIQKVVTYSLCSLLFLLIGWCSASLPIVISLYWLAGDLAYLAFDFVIKRVLSKNKEITKILEDYNAEIASNSSLPDGKSGVESKVEKTVVSSESLNEIQSLNTI